MQKKSPAFREGKNFSLEETSANQFADTPAGTYDQEASPTVTIGSRRRNGNKNYRLDFEARIRSEKIFNAPLALLPIVNDTAEPPADCRRNDTEPAVEVITYRRQQNETQNHKARLAESSKKISQLIFHELSPA